MRTKSLVEPAAQTPSTHLEDVRGEGQDGLLCTKEELHSDTFG